MSDRKPLTFRERAAGTAIIFTALIGVTAVQHALSPAPIPTREPAAPIVLASHVADKVAVDVVEVERAMKQAGFRWEGEKGEEHDALMDTMAEMGMRHVTRALGDDQAMADIEWATTRAEREVAMGRWTVESFDHWANSVATRGRRPGRPRPHAG